jgi:hypothetical protein
VAPIAGGQNPVEVDFHPGQEHQESQPNIAHEIKSRIFTDQVEA